MKTKGNIWILSLLLKRGYLKWQAFSCSILFIIFYLTKSYISGYAHHISTKFLFSSLTFYPYA